MDSCLYNLNTLPDNGEPEMIACLVESLYTADNKQFSELIPELINMEYDCSKNCGCTDSEEICHNTYQCCAYNTGDWSDTCYNKWREYTNIDITKQFS